MVLALVLQSLLSPPMYSASADLLVNRQHDDTQQDLQYNDQQADIQIINTYKNIILDLVIIWKTVLQMFMPSKSGAFEL